MEPDCDSYHLSFREASTIMKLKLILLLIGLCAISLHQAVAEDEKGISPSPLSKFVLLTSFMFVCMILVVNITELQLFVIFHPFVACLLYSMKAK